MKITKEKTLKEIKDSFTSSYPGLKIEFYNNKHDGYQGSCAQNQYDDCLTIVEINSKKDGEIILNDTDTVKEIEQKFENLFGLHIQIFRRSKELWLQTSITDDWTLAMQNRKGVHSIDQN